MSGEVMQYPPTWREFLRQYSFDDDQEVYTNGSDLIPAFRVVQMVDYYFPNRQLDDGTELAAGMTLRLL